jgi:hypothetical protein
MSSIKDISLSIEKLYTWTRNVRPIRHGVLTLNE